MFTTKQITTLDELLEEIKVSRNHYDADTIVDAFEFAEQIHKDDVRKSGKPLVQHLLTTAAYIVRLQLDTVSVVSALLHESLEKSAANLEEIDKRFGTEVAFIIDGLTSFQNQTRAFGPHNENPQNFRRLILNGTEDVRILIIRLSNKIHNLYSWDVLSEERRLNQAHKTLMVYSPLSEYLGLGTFVRIFSDKAFSVLHPKEHGIVTKVIGEIEAERAKELQGLEDEITQMLKAAGVGSFELSRRTKGKLSAYNKVVRKYLNNEEVITEPHVYQLKDLIGLRLIVDTIEQCYLILGLLHGKFDFYQEEFDDYILRPKASGYKSIHTVIDYDGLSVEIQIRTKEMHEYNEFGPASHIAYKLQGELEDSSQDMTWTKDLMEWQNQEQSSKEKFRVKAFAKSIFVFTPKGKVVKLDKGSRPLDFAFQIHTDLGAHYRGAKVNGVMKPMSHELQTGDVVEILVNSKPNVNTDWLKYCSMGYTRQKVKRWIRFLEQGSDLISKSQK